MNYSKIGSIEAICLIIVVILNHIVLNLPKTLLDACGSSTPLNVIYISILVFIFLYLVIKLFKNFSNHDILDVSEFLGGSILRNIVGILFIIYFATISSTLLVNFCNILKLVYFPNMPIFLLLILFLTIAVIANKLGSGTIIKANLIVVPLVMLNLIIAFFAIYPRFVPERIFPIFGYGANETFFSGATNVFAFSGISYIYFIQPMLKKQNSFKAISFISIGISALYVFLSVTCLLFSFSDVLSVTEMSPVYLLIRGTDWGRFIQRPDAIFFLGWILCLMSYLCTIIMLISRIFKKIGNLKAKSPLIYASASLIFILALLPQGIAQIHFLENVIFKYFAIFLLYIISFLILIFANIKYRKTHKNNKESDLLNEK